MLSGRQLFTIRPRLADKLCTRLLWAPPLPPHPLNTSTQYLLSAECSL